MDDALTLDGRAAIVTGAAKRIDAVRAPRPPCRARWRAFRAEGLSRHDRARDRRRRRDPAGSLYHHFDSKESIGDEILSSFINEVLADYRGAVASADSPRAAIEQIVRSTSLTLSQHRAALAMLQNDWSYFAAQPPVRLPAPGAA